MDDNWCRVAAVIVSTRQLVMPGRSLGWAQAVACLPSIDTPDLRAWIAMRDHPGTDGGVRVVPVKEIVGHRNSATHREVCVPADEFAVFITALTAAFGIRRAP